MNWLKGVCHWAWALGLQRLSSIVCSLPLAFRSRGESSALPAVIHVLCLHGLQPSGTISQIKDFLFQVVLGRGDLSQQQKGN